MTTEPWPPSDVSDLLRAQVAREGELSRRLVERSRRQRLRAKEAVALVSAVADRATSRHRPAPVAVRDLRRVRAQTDATDRNAIAPMTPAVP